MSLVPSLVSSLKLVVSAAALAAVACVASPTSSVRVAAGERPDCPGKMICPATGELICVDQCTAASKDPDRADCPGQMICPATGELICIDQCPLAKGKAAPTVAKKTCCGACGTGSSGG
jgi:hypothetical protein